RENAGAAGEKGVVQFKNVSFRYPGAGDDVISGIDFTARRGETVAVVGATGSGKSTLISLIPRFFDCTEGAVLVDGVDVRDYSQEALRDRIGYIPQKALLFSGTVASNISFGDNGRDADERSSTENIERAASISQSAEFIEKMEGAYDAEIAQGGANVSGGQRQRLTIARAIARDPEILVFDDSFSALDYQTDRKLRQELNENTPGVTKFIVAQRIGTIKDADQILVLDHGKIVGRGTHEELLESCDVYKEIALSQLSEEELAKTGA
ncbi:MAG: ABC transporter ATP-binding protein, partial [Anaerovoracaceae bacterium]|nr:ABC transporter ATP-binding protein [Anaerovoracaceae bacterium]